MFVRHASNSKLSIYVFKYSHCLVFIHRIIGHTSHKQYGKKRNKNLDFFFLGQVTIWSKCSVLKICWQSSSKSGGKPKDKLPDTCTELVSYTGTWQNTVNTYCHENSFLIRMNLWFSEITKSPKLQKMQSFDSHGKIYLAFAELLSFSDDGLDERGLSPTEAAEVTGFLSWTKIIVMLSHPSPPDDGAKHLSNTLSQITESLLSYIIIRIFYVTQTVYIWIYKGSLLNLHVLIVPERSPQVVGLTCSP